MIKYLSDIVGVSGAEDDVRDYILSVIEPYCDTVETDSMGNILAKKCFNPDYPTLVLTAHMDEAGFIVSDITDDGYLKFEAIGDIEPLSIISSKVRVGNTVGIIAVKAIHLSTKEEREKKIKISDLYIDIGANTEKAAKEVIQKGDYCSFISEATEFGDRLLKGKAIAGRAGCYLLTRILRSDIKSEYNITCIFSVQNKVSSRGAIVAANSMHDANRIIVLDEINADEENEIKLNNGIVIEKNPYDDTKSLAFAENIFSLAQKNNIETQTAVSVRMTDRERFKEYLPDTETVLLSIPCRYQNTSVSLIGEKDVQSTERLLLRLMEEKNERK